LSTSGAQRVATPELVTQVVREVRRRVAGRRHGAPLVLGVKARPDWSHGDLTGDDGPVRVAACATPLATRVAVSDFTATAGAVSGIETLVVLTDLTEADLGADLLGRFVRPRLYFLDQWNAVCTRLGVRQLDPEFNATSLAWMAEALLTVPLDGVPEGLGTLSVDTGLQILAAAVLGADGITIERLLRATACSDFGAVVGRADPEIVANLCTTLGDRLGAAGALVTGAVATGHGERALPAGLAVAALVGATGHQYAHAMVEALTGRQEFGDAALSAWARAAEQVLDELDAQGDPVVADLLNTGSAMVADWRAPGPEQSRYLGAGFEARLDSLARQLDAFLDDVPGAGLDAVRHAVAQVRDHRAAREPLTRHRATRAELAARLALWLRDPVSGSHGVGAAEERPGFGAVLDGYLADGAWVDAARRRVEEGDDSPASLTAVLTRISDAAYEQRRVGNQRFGRALAAWSEHGTASDLPDAPVVAVEAVLADVAVPLATAERALLVVLDGCGLPQFLEFVGQFRTLGFTEIGRAGRRSAGLAALPTVTDVSRSSLLCGALSPGTAAHEKLGFAGNDRVKRLPGAPAVLVHHRPDLAGGAGRELPPPVRAALAAEGPRLVGAVVNTIDDELSLGAFTREYALENLGPLQALLRAALDAGRFVIVTADHGHVLGVGLDGRGDARRGGEGGDRWREADREPEDDEVLLRGPRVLRGGDRGIIAPVHDDLRYSARHGGYHGGATPDECLVPLSVFQPPGVETPSGWEPVLVAPPAWWDLAATPAPEPVNPPAGRRPRPKPVPTGSLQIPGTETEVPTEVPGTAAPAVPRPAWVDRLIASDTYREQTKRVARAAIADDRVIAALAALDARGGVAGFGVIAQATDMPLPRVPGFLAVLAGVLNVDGYGVLTVDASAQEARLEVALLRTQFLGDSAP
jgi:hypothetical protein